MSTQRSLSDGFHLFFTEFGSQGSFEDFLTLQHKGDRRLLLVGDFASKMPEIHRVLVTSGHVLMPVSTPFAHSDLSVRLHALGLPILSVNVFQKESNLKSDPNFEILKATVEALT